MTDSALVAGSVVTALEVLELPESVMATDSVILTHSAVVTESVLTLLVVLELRQSAMVTDSAEELTDSAVVADSVVLVTDLVETDSVAVTDFSVVVVTESVLETKAMGMEDMWATESVAGGLLNDLIVDVAYVLGMTKMMHILCSRCSRACRFLPQTGFPPPPCFSPIPSHLVPIQSLLLSFLSLLSRSRVPSRY